MNCLNRNISAFTCRKGPTNVCKNAQSCHNSLDTLSQRYALSHKIQQIADCLGITTHEIVEKCEQFVEQNLTLEMAVQVVGEALLSKKGRRRWPRVMRKGVLRAQFGETLFSLPGQVSQTLESVTNATQKAEETLGVAKDAATSVNTLIKLVSDYAQQLRDWFKLPSMDVIVLSTTLFGLLKSLYCGDFLGIVLGGAAFARQLDLGLTIVQDCYVYVQKFFEGFKDPVKPAAQGFFEPNWVGGTLMLLITSLSKGYLPSYDVSSKLLSDFGRSAIGFKNLKELAEYLYKYARILFYKHICGRDIEQMDQEALYPNLANVLQMCDLLRSPEFKTVYLDRSKELCKNVINLSAELEVLKKQADSVKDVPMKNALAAQAVHVEKFAKLARSSAAFCKSTKIAPTAAFLYGKAGVGKSVLVEYLKVALYEEYYKNSSWTQNDLSFTRAMDSDYWDGYCGQPILCYDDIFQRKDSQGSPCPDYMDIISIVNESPFHLNMSAVEDKKNCYMECDFVLASSNINAVNPTSIQSADAVRRRFDYPVEVSVKQEFRVSGGEKLDLEKVARHHSLNGTSGFLPEAYEIWRIDLAQGNRIGEVQTLDEFVTELKQIHKEKRIQSRDLAESFRRVLGVENEKVSDDDFSAFLTKMDTPLSSTNPDIDVNADLWKAADYVNGIVLNSIQDQKIRLDTLKDDMLKNVYAAKQYVFDTINEKFVDATDDEYSVYNIVNTTVSESFQVFKEKAFVYFDKSAVFVDACLQRCKIVIDWSSIKGTAQTFFAKICEYLYVDNLVLGTCGVIIGSLAGLAIGHLIKWVFTPCRLERIKTFEDAKNFNGGCECEKCKGIFRTEKMKDSLGSCEHGLGFLRHVAENASSEEVRARCALLYTTHAKRVFTESRMYPDGSPSVVKRSVFAEGRAYPDGTPYQPHRAVYAEGRMYPDGTPYQPSRPLLAEGVYPDGSPVSPRRVPLAEAMFDSSTLKVQRYRDGKPVAQQSDCSMLQIQEAIARTNMVRLVTPDGASLNALFLTGRVFLVPAHFWERITTTFQVRNPFMGVTTELEKSACVAHRCTTANDRVIDLVLVEGPRSLPSRRNIINYFAPGTTFPLAEEGTIVVTGLRDVGGVACMMSMHASKFSFDTSMLCYTDGVKDHYVNENIAYDIDTKPGDCGAVVMVRNNGMLGKIVGMHVAGLKGEGYAAAISREFIMRNMQSVLSTESLVDARVPFAEMARVPHHFGAVKLSGDYVSLGNLPAPKTSGKSNIFKSLICGALGATTMAPAMLRPTNGIDPMANGVKKVLNVQPILPSAILNAAVRDVEDIHLSAGDFRKVLSYEEALRGIPEHGIVALNRSTSPGYPYSLSNPKSGKHHWFGNDEWIINEEIRKDVNDLLDLARQNKRGDVVYVATLKDERRALEKVLAGKTRVFAAAPMHYVIAFRMYFSAFIASIMDNRIENEIGVGTNVYSLDWTRTAKKLQKFGDAVIAGDFSNFDGSLHQEILWKILDLVNKWYDDSAENQAIRRVLFEDICNARMLVDGEIVHMTHSQPSGNPMTVIINSIFNQIVMRMAYIQTKVDSGGSIECDFRKVVSMQTYGDDNCLNISPAALEMYNQNTITPALAKFGLTYTDETKSNDTAPYRSLFDIGYLKRSFVSDDFGNFDAPLNFGVILEMCNWIKGKTSPKASLALNVEVAMTELGLHGESVYNQWSTIIARECRNVDVKVRIPCFEEVEDFHYLQKYGMSKHVTKNTR